LDQDFQPGNGFKWNFNKKKKIYKYGKKFYCGIIGWLFSMKNVGLIFVPSFYFRTGSLFFLGWNDPAGESFGKKITLTKISC
jgi:hypothetical protein